MMTIFTRHDDEIILTLTLAGGGGSMRPPPELFSRIMLKFSRAFGASFAQLLVKKNGKKDIMSGHFYEKWRIIAD